jgi:hypothetical protein
MAQNRNKIKSAIGGPQKSGVEGNFQPGLGRQLSRKVESGRLTEDQAERTARQRSLLAKAFGKDWREVAFGKGGAKSYPTYGYKGPTELNEKRLEAIQRAKKKLGLNGGTTAP